MAAIQEYEHMGSYWTGIEAPSISEPEQPPQPSAQQSAVQSEADQIAKEASYVLEGTLDIAVPNPHLKSRLGVKLLGLGKNFSGIYNVTTVVHHITSTMYAQKVEVKRNNLKYAPEPSDDVQPSVEHTPPPVVDISEPIYHTVVAGDSLWSIAEKYYGDGQRFALIATANGISSTADLVVGQRLLIPISFRGHGASGSW